MIGTLSGKMNTQRDIMISWNMTAKVIFVGVIIYTLLLTAPALAVTAITGRIVAIDEHANIIIALSAGDSVPAIGDKVELSRQVHGGIAAYRVGTWTVTEVNGALISADLQFLSGKDRPQVNESAHIFVSEAKVGKEQGSPSKTNRSYAARLQSKCEQGDMQACVGLGLMYKRGDRVTKDGQEAFKLIIGAAESGDVRAQYELSWLYQFGTGVKASRNMGNKWMRKAADQGMAKAQNSLGYFAITNKDYANAKKWYRKAAEQGNSEAQYKMGVLYAYDRYANSGAMVFKADYRKAAYWFLKAAEQHYVSAQTSLADMYDRGKGIPRDREEAIKWYRRAADNGDTHARSVLEKKGVVVQDPREISIRKRKEVPLLRGVHVVDITAALRQQHDIHEVVKGVLINRVEAGSLAVDLLLAGDVIMTINGKTIKDTSDYETLPYVNLAELEALKIYANREDYFVNLELALPGHDATGSGWGVGSKETETGKSEKGPATGVDLIPEDLGEL